MRILALILGTLVAAGCSRGGKVPQIVGEPRSIGAADETVEFDDPRIQESSGLASSQTRDGVLFTLNDSGGKAAVYRLDLGLKEVREIAIDGARNVDWEDLASATIDGRPYLFIADIGDNAGRRSDITVYRVEEPGAFAKQVPLDRTYRLRYPDEPRNAETLLVDPKTGAFWVITKAGQRPSIAYLLERPTGRGTETMRKVGEFQVGGSLRESRTITGGAVSPDGAHVVLRTYLAGYEWPKGSIDERWFERSPSRFLTPFELQGEAVTYSRDGQVLYTSSEGTPLRINRLPIRP